MLNIEFRLVFICAGFPGLSQNDYTSAPFHARVLRPLQNMIGWRFYDFVYQCVLSGINIVKIRKDILLIDTGVRYSTFENKRYLIYYFFHIPWNMRSKRYFYVFIELL